MGKTWGLVVLEGVGLGGVCGFFFKADEPLDDFFGLVGFFSSCRFLCFIPVC